MSYRGDDGEIPDRFRLDYAPTSRATCKGCGRAILQAEVRCGIKVRSAFHDGFDMHWNHALCGARQGASGPASFKGFQRLRWDDQVKLAQALKQPLELAKPCVSRTKRINEMVWEVYDLISSVPKKLLRDALEQNQRFVTDKMSPYELAYTISDLVVNGMLPACPFCSCEALVGEGGQIRCAGFAAGTSTCSFNVVIEPVLGGQVGSDEMLKRTARLGTFELTPALEKALKKWSMPPDAPVRSVSGGGAPCGAVCAAAESASEDEVDPPHGYAMAGLAVASVGSTSPDAAELRALVEANGGEWINGSVGDGSCLSLLVTAPAELDKKKPAVKLATALSAGVPVVSADYLLLLAGVEPGKRTAAKPSARPMSKSNGAPSAERGAPPLTGGGAGDTLDTDEVSSMRVAELRSHLEARGLSTSGTKPVLVKRLHCAAQSEAALRSEQHLEDARKGKAKVERLRQAQPPPPKRVKTGAAGAPTAPPPIKGVLLRQRKHMQPFLLRPEAGAGARLPRLAAAIEQKKAAEMRSAHTKKPPRTFLPPVMVGSALSKVEPGAHKPASTEVYIDEYNLAWHSVLNSVNLSEGTNKYYRMQLLRTGSNYCIYKGWGRVGGGVGGKSSGRGGSGRNGRMNSDLVHDHGRDLQGAKEEFRAKFKELTRLDFEWAEPPVQAPGGYFVTLIPGQMSTAANPADRAPASPTTGGFSFASSKLPEPVARLVSLIGDKRMMAAQLEEMHVDLDKMPLGSISDVQIRRGYAALNELANALQSPASDPSEQRHKLLALTTEFYTIVPHRFDLCTVPPVIDTLPALREKLDMVEALLQIAESQRLSRKLGPAADAHPIDAMYAQLGVQLEPASMDEVEMVRKYAANTHGSTHSTYTIRVKDVLRVHKEEEAARFRGSELNNRKLLWHGSRLTNWTGILSQGLRIAPPEAPATGYMFGKGVYFADVSSKSANYTSATSANPTAVLLLCDVALGEQYERLNAEYEAPEMCVKHRKHSTWGVGQFAPDEAGAHQLDEGKLHVPMGKSGESRYLKEHFDRLRRQEGGRAKAALLYNEYIVYDLRQIRMKYVVVCELDYV